MSIVTGKCMFIRQSFVIGVKKKKKGSEFPLNQSETKLDEIVARSISPSLVFPALQAIDFS